MAMGRRDADVILASLMGSTSVLASDKYGTYSVFENDYVHVDDDSMLPACAAISEWRYGFYTFVLIGVVG